MTISGSPEWEAGEWQDQPSIKDVLQDWLRKTNWEDASICWFWDDDEPYRDTSAYDERPSRLHGKVIVQDGQIVEAYIVLPEVKS